MSIGGDPRSIIVEVAVVGYMALVALIIGTAQAALSTGRVTLSLVASAALAWAFVPVIQLLSGLWLVRGTRDTTGALGGYFALHRPWSLWVLTLAAAVLIVPGAGMVIIFLVCTALIPLLWTKRLLTQFCLRELSLPPAAAKRRARIHQSITVALILSYLVWGSALWPRVVRMAGL